jgi:hypothetical protein
MVLVTYNFRDLASAPREYPFGAKPWLRIRRS